MDALLFGLALGFFSGVSPGPLMTLVLSTTLQRGFKAGMLTAMAPLLTDTPVILLSLVALRSVPEGFLRIVTLAGGVFVVYIGFRTVRDARAGIREPEADTAAMLDLARGALVNLLSPHPWIFWVTVGTPILLTSWAEAPWHAIAFLVSFLGLLVGSKVVLAWTLARGRHYLNTRWYRWVLGTSGLLLMILGALLVLRGL